MTVATVAVVTVGARAQGVIQAPAGQAFTIISNVPASAITEVAYQWYRDNSLIPNATKESYTVPAGQAYGDNVQFYRMATAQECAGVAEKKSNIVTITFTGYIIPVGCKLVIGGVCWADANVDNPQTFATRPDMRTKLYQWNRLTTYSADEPLTPAWNSTADQSETWTVNPCPPNWRLPTQAEYQQLNSSGTTWADANTRGNLVDGRFYGYNHTTCRLPSTMQGCVFFPVSGLRDNPDGTLGYNTNGLSWSSTQTNNSFGYNLNFTITNSNPDGYSAKSRAESIRCVQ